VQIRTATPADADFFATRLRPSDHEEVAAVVGQGHIRSAIMDSITSSEEGFCRVAVGADGVPFAVYGASVAPGQPGACIWLVGTPALDRQRKFLLTTCREFVEEAGERYGFLFNLVAANNTRSVRWLQRLGFTIAAPVEYGIAKQLFHPFYRPCASLSPPRSRSEAPYSSTVCSPAMPTPSERR